MVQSIRESLRMFGDNLSAIRRFYSSTLSAKSGLHVRRCTLREIAEALLALWLDLDEKIKNGPCKGAVVIR